MPQRDALVEVTDGLFELRVGKRLGPELEKNLLFGFQNGFAGMGDTVDGLECGIIAACIHVYFHQVVADLFGIRRVRELVQEFLEDGHRFAESGIGGLVNA